MFKWIQKIFQEKEMPVEELSISDMSSMNISDLLVQWFNFFDLYHDAYGYGYKITREIHPLMDFRWGCYHFNGGVSYYSKEVSITCTKKRFSPVSYKGTITVRVEDTDICVWENGNWRHDTPQVMKDKVYEHLLTIAQFNLDCKKVNFKKLIAEKKEKEERQEKEKKENEIKTAPARAAAKAEEERREQEEKVKAYQREQDLLTRHFSDAEQKQII